MKKILLSFMLLCLATMQAAAATWTDSNRVTWTFSKSNWNYSGENHSYWTITGAENYGDDVVVPGIVYDGETACTVEALGSYLFQNNKTLSSVSLPASLKCIGYNTFYECSGLTTVGDISKVEDIYGQAFSGCSQLSSVDLSSCQVIDGYAFAGCSKLSGIGSVASCTTFGYSSFNGCSSLQSVDLQENVSLGSYAFAGCSSLQNIGTLKGSTLGEGAFNNCTSLTAVDLSATKSVGTYAFIGCTNLKTVGNLSAFTAIDNGVFYGCQNLESVNLSNCKSVGESAFYGCQKLQSVDLSQVKTLGNNAFGYCSNLETVGDISSLTDIPNYAFINCNKLQNVNLANVKTIGSYAFQSCITMTEVSLPVTTTIADYAFGGCTNLASISLPQVTSIGGGAFYGCTSLVNPEISSTTLTSIGNNVFSTPGVLTLMATTPATLSSSDVFGPLMIIRVPDASLAAYRSADKWSDFALRIIGMSTKTDYDVTVIAEDKRSALHDVIGEDKLGTVVSLKVTGSINGYDIMVIRNKMDNLHHLDLTDANIVANDYEYYTGNHTEDNVLGAMSFYNLEKLLSVKLPKRITSIGYSAFRSCRNLKEVEFQPGLKSIGSYAFQQCSNLRAIDFKEGLETIGDYAFGDYQNWDGDQPQIEELIIPYGVTSIGDCAFGYNTRLKRVALPTTLKQMGSGVFSRCGELQSISLPTSLESIPGTAFHYCSSLKRVDIPSTIRSIGDEAFGGCPNLLDVYTYIAEPTSINMNTFCTYTTATLHVPFTSYYNYWYDTEWSQFRYVAECEALYKYFYINKDFTIGDEKGTIQGVEGEYPDADLNPGSGLIVETSKTNPQELDVVHIKMNDTGSASIISANNLTANKACFDIDVDAGRWYFLSFPFNVSRVNVTAPGAYVFRLYDPKERAEGRVGWLNWVGDKLLKGVGYIFHCAKSGTLSLGVEKADMDWDADDRSLPLEANPATNKQDASWNFMGNPHTSYFDIDLMGYMQPITIWNGSSYDAVRPGDDCYAFKPFEAFFVQKPDGHNEMSFPANGRFTKRQWAHEQTMKAAARRSAGVSTDRQLINLTLSDGTNEDKTRVVFNEQRTKEYEMECDAPKFLSSEQVPQLYTLDQQQGQYAINERPTGEVQIGYVATMKGELTIAATRMDQPVLLRDNEMQTTHDLSLGGYTFTTEAGTNNSRFTLVTDGSMTGVGQLRKLTGVSVMAEEGGISFLGTGNEQVSVYSTGGTLLAGKVGDGFVSLPKAAYIIKVGTATTKVIVR